MNQFRGLVVFDWNGTLIDDVKAAWGGFQVVQEQFGHKPCSLADYQAGFDIPISKLYRSAGFTEEEIQNNLRNMQPVFHDEYERRGEKCGLRKGAKELLVTLCQDNICCVVLSNHLYASIEGHCRRFEIEPYLADIMANGTTEKQLAAPSKGEKLRLYMDAHGFSKEQTIIVGDTPEEAIIGHNLGIVSVALTGGWASEARLAAAHPTFTIAELDQMPGVIRQVFQEARP